MRPKRSLVKAASTARSSDCVISAQIASAVPPRIAHGLDRTLRGFQIAVGDHEMPTSRA